MDTVSRKTILQLAKPTKNYVVSIYMPTHRAGGREQRQDKIRFNNLLSQAEDHLLRLDMTKRQVEAILAEAHRLSKDEEFWRHQQDGLAVFISKKRTRAYRLPVSFTEACVVAKRYHVKPLLHLWDADDHFYVLAVSPNQVRMSRGTQTGIEPVISKRLPQNINEALGYDDNERAVQFHLGSETRGARPGTIFHGHGAAKDLGDIDPPRFVRAVAHAIDRELNRSKAPVVFAGVDELFALYREANQTANLHEVHIPGNHDDTPLEHLHQRAMGIVRPVFEADRHRAVADYQQLAASEPKRVADDAREILRHAMDGRVQSLLVLDDAPEWGEVGEDGKVVIHTEQQPGSVDILDVLTAHTLHTSGDVHMVEKDAVPGHTQVVAVLRY